MRDNESVVGILGGMGPAATHEFFGRIINETKVERDQDHLRIIVDNNPKIPDRTEYLIGQGTSPLPALRRSARNLEESGADILTIPCNTSHAFVDDISSSVSMDVINMIYATVEYIRNEHSNINNVLLLATTGTIESHIYQRYCKDFEFEIVLPDDDDQEKVMASIYGVKGVKAGFRDVPKKKLLEVIENTDNIDAVITGCTEISLVLSNDDLEVEIIDPLDVLARKTVHAAKDKRSPLEIYY